MRWIEVKGKSPLVGNIIVPGSKNSALAIIVACCLSNEIITLKNVPNVSDIDIICNIGDRIGLILEKHEDILLVDPRYIHSSAIDPKESSGYRASYYFIGALLAKFKKVSIGYPGGDNFGSRPIDQHIKGLEALGAMVNFYEDYFTIEADNLIGANIYFDVITSGATINVILAAVLATGKTILRNAARDPEVVDLSIFLNNQGARIKGMGTDTITIEGVKSLGGVTHTIIPDRLIAGSFLIGAGATGGNVTVNEITPEHLLACIAKLEEAGVTVDIGDNYINASLRGELVGVSVKTAMYPGFATDLQQPFTAMLLAASSHSTIVDKVYPGRFNHCYQLNRMGADIIIKEGSVVIPAKRKIVGSWVHATDVRAGMCLILAGLMAEGTTCITGVEHIERGYADVIHNFKSLGADIRMCEDVEMQLDHVNSVENMM